MMRTILPSCRTRAGRWCARVNGNYPISSIRSTRPEFGLFDLVADPGETHNLAESKPEKYRELLELWRMERRNLGIVLPQDL